jgi:hypothetical protein
VTWQVQSELPRWIAKLDAQNLLRGYHLGGGPKMSTPFNPVKANELDMA